MIAVAQVRADAATLCAAPTDNDSNHARSTAAKAAAICLQFADAAGRKLSAAAARVARKSSCAHAPPEVHAQPTGAQEEPLRSYIGEGQPADRGVFRKRVPRAAVAAAAKRVGGARETWSHFQSERAAGACKRFVVAHLEVHRPAAAPNAALR